MVQEVEEEKPRFRTNDAQKVPEDKFRTFEPRPFDLISDMTSQFEVVNLDQTMCHFDLVSCRINEIQGTRRVRITHTHRQIKRDLLLPWQ